MDSNVIEIGKFATSMKKLILPWIIVLIVILVVFFGSTCFYSVEPDEVGVVLRFGRYRETTPPGLHYKLPFGIEKIIKVKVKRINKEEFGFRTELPGRVTHYSADEYYDESLMLTGDLNSLVVEWIVQYKIKDPFNFLFKIQENRSAIRDLSEAVMRQVVGDYTVDDVLSEKRLEISQKAQADLQKILDEYESGIQIVTVKLQNVNPYKTVQPAFNEVNEAKQEKEKMINEAWEAYNKVIPRARGEAEKLIREAEAYQIDRINRAKGEAKRFITTWEEYRKAKEITKRRLYLETLSQVLKTCRRKFIIDPRQESILPLLRLEPGGEK